MIITQKCIFDDSSKLIFYDLLKTFEAYFANDILMELVATNGSKFLDINFNKNSIFKENYYTILINALDCYQPFLRVDQLFKNRIELQCCFYNFGIAKGESFIYMVKNTMDWTNNNNFYCQVINLIEPNEETIQNFWRS